jgi:hypothetical protein
MLWLGGSVVIANIINGFTAFGTIAVAAAAIWGDWLRSRLAPAKLILAKHNLEGDPTTFIPPGTRVMFYLLKVVNQRRWASAQNCRVMLVGLSRRDASGVFQPVPMSVPSQFTWSPSEFMPPMITVVREQVLDLGCIVEGSNSFTPRFYWNLHNFQGFVHANEAVRYQLQIEAVNFASPIYVVEVAWDGVWDYNPATMKTHLPVRIIPPAGT